VAVVQIPGDQLLSVSGYPLGLKRPSLPLSAWSGGGMVPLAGEGRAISYTQLYRTQPWVATVVNKLTRQISRLPLKLYEKDSQNNRKQLHDHPLAELLSKPWERGGPTHLKQKIALPTLLHGNSLIAKLRPSPGAPPSSLLPIDWRFVIPHGLGGIQGAYIPTDVLFWEIVYPDEKRFVAPEETLHFKWEAPDGGLGVSPLQQLGVTIASEDAAQRYTAASFNNATRPSGAVVLPADVRNYREIREDIRQEIEQIHGGVDNAFRVAVLGGGLEWKEMGLSAREAELIQTRRVNREEIAAVYDIPPPMIGILDQATYSNIAEQHRMLYVTVLGTWLTMIEETIKAQLIDAEPSWEGLFVEFDISEQLKGDPKVRAAAEAIWVTHGIYTINEIRKLENLPTIDNPVCDMPLIPVNNLAPPTSLQPQLENPVDGDPEDGDQEVPGATPPDAPTTVSNVQKHLDRAGDRVARKWSAGSTEPWDRDRFERELAADLAKAMPAPDAGRLASTWGEALTAVVKAARDPQDLRRSFVALQPVRAQ
jgi:HK97 family phage portal protein